MLGPGINFLLREKSTLTQRKHSLANIRGRGSHSYINLHIYKVFQMVPTPILKFILNSSAVLFILYMNQMKKMNLEELDCIH